jgi:anti-sigma factor RsiW
MKPCEDWHRKIVRVLDNEAGDEDEREVAEHLHVCASCREFHDKFAKIRGEFRSVAEPKVPAGIRQNLVREIEDSVGMRTSRSSLTERTYKDSVLLRHPRWKWYLGAVAPFLIWRRSSAWRRAEQVAAAVLIASVAFLGGRLSVPHKLPRSVDVAPRAVAEADGVNVPSDLVAWLDAARLFRQLGMEDRMADAVESAIRLLPSDAVVASSVMEQSFTRTGVDVFENQNKHSILAEILGPHESGESVSGIMAQSFGGYYYESKMD